MTPTQLNKRVRAGEIWYTTNYPSPLTIVRKAESRNGKVFVKTDSGKHVTEKVREFGSNNWVNLYSEGVLTWAVN